jgi:Pyruvate/2-oxoacid:ferredoxin oxidoreductase delta subunit
MDTSKIDERKKRNFWSFLFKPSTLAFIKEAKNTPGFSVFDWIHGYFYIRWPYLYIGVGTEEHRLTRLFLPIWRIFKRLWQPKLLEEQTSQCIAFADTYHGKVVPLEQATRLVSVNRDVELKDLERVIPYAHARDIILHNPDHIAVLQCPCRASRSKPCQPLDVCLIVGEPFASFIVEHHPRRARWITREECMEILREEHERGHVHHAFFKDAMLGRFYAICNCCSCCCGAIQAWRNGTPMLTSSGYVSQIDQELCILCETCLDYCQFGAIKMNDDKLVVDEEVCMGCGVCVSKCTCDAHSLVRDPSKGEPLEIHKLM